MAFNNNQIPDNNGNQQNTMGNNSMDPGFVPPPPQYNPYFKTCRYCKGAIERNAKICPLCGKKQGDFGSAFAMGVLFLVVIGMMFIRVLSENRTIDDIVERSSSSSSSNYNSDVEETSSSSSSSHNSKVKEDPTSEVKVTDYHVSEDSRGNAILVVEYKYYNGNDKPQSFMWEFNDKCYQNGVECSDTVLTLDEEDIGKQSADVLPGYTSYFSIGYKVERGSDVNLVVSKYLQDDVVIDMIIHID